MFNRKTIFVKLFLTSLLILLVSFLIFAVIFNYLLHNVLLKSYQDMLFYQRDRLTEYINEVSDKEIDPEIFHSSLALSMYQEHQTTYIFGSDGEPAYFNPDDEMIAYVKQEYIEKALDNQEFVRKIRGDGRPMFVVSSPMHISSAENPDHAMVVVLHGVDREVKPIKLLNFMAIIVTVIVTGTIIFFASRKITAPLRELNENVLQFAKGDFSKKVTINRKDEIGQLGQSVNYMAKELASIEQMRRDFVANVSHDLRSPLTSIKGFLVAILDGTIPEQKRSHYLSIMKNETERLIKLVNDLLDMTKLESKQLSIVPSTYNISEQLRLVIAKMEPELLNHKIEVDLQGVEDDIFVMADADRIEQVVFNLIQNSIHFSSNGSKVEVHQEKGENEVQIKIKDYGRGISEEDLGHIWDRFYKVDKARSRKLGTGIGLSIVKQILDQHDISIKVDSKLGIGTEFVFSLPLSKR